MSNTSKFLLYEVVSHSVLHSEISFKGIFAYYGESESEKYIKKLGQHTPLRSERSGAPVSMWVQLSIPSWFKVGKLIERNRLRNGWGVLNVVC